MSPSTASYLRAFEKLRARLAPTLSRAGLHCEVAHRLNSASLKVSKPTWSTGTAGPPDARIFFCIWIEDKPRIPNRLAYSIHALQTWRLKIKSRDFASALRKELAPTLKSWPNASLDYGPANVMEGWVDVEGPTDTDPVAHLVQSFVPVAPAIDRALRPRRGVARRRPPPVK